MQRLVYNKLLSWKSKKKRKPLILRGARQVGKSWLMDEFGKNEFEYVAKINFEENKHLSNLFENDFDIERILRSIEIATETKLVAGKTLIILDEIQIAKRAILSLKYLYEKAPEFHIIAAGSLLGISQHKGESFPVGKVEFIDIYPVNFEEFLISLNKNHLLDNLKSLNWNIIESFKTQYVELLKLYYYVGGMPEVVQTYIESKDFNEVREIQKTLLDSYVTDFSKHPPLEIVPRIKLIWDNIASQLAKENKKFIYSAVKKGSRAKDFELAIEWLCQAGLIYKIQRTNNHSLPLSAFTDINSFKLFIVDIGLLGAICNLDSKTLINGNTLFNQYKGALTEQFVLQQLLSLKDANIKYWSSDNSKSELDFLIQLNNKLIPIEVKAEENLKAKSLKTYIEKYNPEMALRISMSNYRKEEKFTNLPLYATFLIDLL